MKSRRSNQLPNNLPQLQNLLKQDPHSYKEEFLQQRQHFDSMLALFFLDPGRNNHDLESVMMFLANVAHCYKEDMENFPHRLMDVLKDHQSAIHPDMRLAFCRALILLRNKGLVAAIRVMETFFLLMRLQDKKLRSYLESFIVADVKNVNVKHHDIKVNTILQNFMFGMTRESNSTSARIALSILMELYRKNVWKDSKVVNVIAAACLRKDVKVVVTALQFFLGSDPDARESDASDSEDSDGELLHGDVHPSTVECASGVCSKVVDKILRSRYAGFVVPLGAEIRTKLFYRLHYRILRSRVDTKTAKEMIRAGRVKKKSRKLKKQLVKLKQTINKSKKKKKAPGFNYSAFHLLNDPQGFAEKLFQRLEKLNERFEVKLMFLNLISRLVGIHELLLLPFYPYLSRFLQPHQREVIHLLTYTAQAMHPLIPPDVGEALLKTIANNFITERNSSEVMAVGLNAVREICARCPLAITSDLLSDLTEYKSHREKAVSMASRSLITLFRETNPGLLRKKDRGKPTESMAEIETTEYGALAAKDYVPGAEVLLQTKIASKKSTEADAESDADSDDEDDGEEAEEGSEGEEIDGEGSGEENSDDEESEGDSEGEEDESTIITDASTLNDSIASSAANTTLDTTTEEKGKKRKISEVTENDDVNAPPVKALKKNEAAAAVTVDRILTQRDFKKIESAQAAKKLQGQSRKEAPDWKQKLREAKRLRKRKQAKKPIKDKSEDDEWEDLDSDEEDSDEDSGKSDSDSEEEDEEENRLPGIVLVKDIEMIHAKKKHDRESRLASVQEGRTDRKKFGKRLQRQNPTASSSNQEKLKKKPFMMVREKLKKKQRQSFRDRQVRLRNALLKQKRMIVK